MENGMFTASPESSVLDNLNTGTGILTGLVNTGMGVYNSLEANKLNKDKWATEKQKMQQEYIAKQRQMQWDNKFRDLMLGVAPKMGV